MSSLRGLVACSVHRVKENIVELLRKVKEFIGNLWGQTTTQVLGFLIMIQPAFLTIDPSLLVDYPQLRMAIFALGVIIMGLRFFAPPPPAVPIKTEDKVVRDDKTGKITIYKEEPISPAIVSKDAGTTVQEARAEKV